MFLLLFCVNKMNQDTDLENKLHKYLDNNYNVQLLIDKHSRHLSNHLQKVSNKIIKKQNKDKFLSEYISYITEYCDKIHDNQVLKLDKILDEKLEILFLKYKEDCRKDINLLRNNMYRVIYSSITSFICLGIFYIVKKR